ncbi:hypothetical protein B0H66DRAFT_357738 [Apodospora peruviana]|uniref:Alternative oxidase n=1 Tax=Apodospora peruviana TaxID=516989 RepID=A0AAE0HVH2_9PEZI|nr:hypothetical protein B0H66DRAFT_357738 [Apodospora peruviana]
MGCFVARSHDAIGILARHRTLLVVVCLTSLVTLWLCRLPKIKIYSPPFEIDVTGAPAAAEKHLDLSRADAPFISWPLARVCNEARWSPGIVFVCDNNSGGVGNIRNYILTCLRYAIEAGATGLVMPQIRTRAPDNLSSIMQAHQPFAYFFDEDHFRQSLGAACPQISIYQSTDHIPNAVNPFKVERITPRDFGPRGGCDNRGLNQHSDGFGRKFRAHVEEHAAEFNIPTPSPAHPRAYRLTWGVQFDWQTYRDGPEFATSYGGLLRFRADILKLGMQTAAYMREFAARQAGHTESQTFVGMHLRTESDALSNWPRFENQTRAYLERASSMDFKAAYLATGNSTEAAKLASAASSQHGLAVVTKDELLKDHPRELKALKALTWDQQALIDFVVLLEGDYFLGVNPSSFSMNVALKRHLKMDGLHTRPWKTGGDGDGRSWLVGSYEHYWKDWLFMYDSMWP